MAPSRASIALLLALVSFVLGQAPDEIAELIELESESNSSNATSPLDELSNIILTIPDDELDEQHCALLGPLALGIQAAMGVIVLLSLLLKRARERPKRPWKIWTLDVSKQVIGQAWVHATNVAISNLIASHSQDEQNPCTLCEHLLR